MISYVKKLKAQLDKLLKVEVQVDELSKIELDKLSVAVQELREEIQIINQGKKLDVEDKQKGKFEEQLEDENEGQRNQV